MTFKQLVDKYSFEEIIPELAELWDKGNIYLFRQALDILRSLQPSECIERNVIEVSKVANEYESYNRVSNLSGWGWNENLDWEIEVSDDCNLSEKQLLALCLWERTFYGFSPEQESEYFNDTDSMCEDTATEPSETDRRRNLITDICSNYSDINPEDLEFLLSDNELIFHTFTGLSDSPGGEIEYISESIAKYSDLPRALDKGYCVALLCTPHNNDSIQPYLSKLINTIKLKTACFKLHLHVRISECKNHTTATIIYPALPNEY